MLRRDFLRHSAASASLALSSPFQWLPKAFATNEHRSSRLSWRAYQSTEIEGSWDLGMVEGRIPYDLKGSLYRIGPGSKRNYGVDLKHLFDGDAHLSIFTFGGGQISARSAFVDSPERQAERVEGRMLYNEFGTKSPGTINGFKNSPNVNAMELDGRILTFSDGGAPVALNQETLATEGVYDFNGTFPKWMTMTAHPKIDPYTGELFTFGFTQAFYSEVVSFKHEKATGTLKKIASFPISQFYMIHDMMVTENYLIFMIPPVYIQFWGALMSSGTLADLIKYEAGQPFEIVIVRKDGRRAPVRIKNAPGGCVFHHANAYEDPRGNIIFDTVLCDNDDYFSLVKAWAADYLPKPSPTWLTRFKVDPRAGRILSREVLSDGKAGDFPTVDPRRIGRNYNYTYMLEADIHSGDPLAMNTLVKWDVKRRSPLRVQAPPNQVFGEMIFVPRAGDDNETNGYILHLGYDGSCNQSFIDIRQAANLNLEGRVWMGRPIPLGFHGTWTAT